MLTPNLRNSIADGVANDKTAAIFCEEEKRKQKEIIGRSCSSYLEKYS